MPDRVANVSDVIYLDWPAATEPVTVTVTSPVGAAALTDAATTKTGESRYYAALAPTTQGLWTAVFTDAVGKSQTLRFTVGAKAQPLTRSALRLLVAGYYSEVIYGAVTEYSEADAALTDADMVGGPGNYFNYWVILFPESGTELAGQARRVIDYSGQALLLSRPFTAAPAAGDRFALLRVDPRELDRAIAAASAELAERTRVTVSVSGVALAAAAQEDFLEATVPAGVSRLYGVYDSDGNEMKGWLCIPGGKIRLPTGQDNREEELTTADTLTLIGTRDLFPPRFEDSTIDIEPKALQTRAVVELFTGRSASPGLDPKESMRRHMIAQQEFEVALRQTAGRVSPGTQKVIP